MHEFLGILSQRQLIEVSGEEAASFLQTLITTNIDEVDDGGMMAGALLSPQGKILFDFLVGRQMSHLFLDTHQHVAETLVKRLNLYKLRSKIEIILHEPMPVVICQNHIGTPEQMGKPAKFCFTDKRFNLSNKHIMRLYGVNDIADEQGRQEWDQLRIREAIAESGMDFALGDVFPHDINLDQIGGISFTKGCYIGQEVVSRMQHRGTARRRLMLAYAQTPLPESGTVIEAGGKILGQLGSHVEMKEGATGLALVRLDRVKMALDKGQSIEAGGVELRLEIPERVNFTYPETKDGNM